MTDENHWQLIEAAHFHCPAPPAVNRFQRGWRGFRRMVGINEPDAVEPEEGAELPDYREFDRAPAVAALAKHLAEEFAGAEKGVCFLLDPPFSGTAAIARDWTWQQGRSLLTPPDIHFVRANAVEHWWQQQSCHGPWVIDDLARYLLRSADGLRFIRALLPRLLHGDFGQGLVVCDSWTFAFLRRTWPLTLPRVFCFAPASPALLRQVGIRGSEHKLGQLAARARGNVGMALALWACQSDEHRQLAEPPPDVSDSTAFILFALLLHRGLTREVLQQVLPVIVPDQLDVQLLQLEQLGIVVRKPEHWRLSVYGYLAVREILGSRDYLLDDF